MPQSALLEKVRKAINSYKLIRPGEKIIVGVSGGPDSVALLYLLNALKKKLNFSLHVAHLDHMLRPDSDEDNAFVEGLAYKLKLPFTSAKINVKGLAGQSSLEEIARNARLGFLFRVAKENNAKTIALGHNFDDQAETVLMRILRGAGLFGLSGILPKRNIYGYQIIRPLIEVRRSKIESYLKKKKIKARIDSSNLSDIYFRNKIRHKLLPLLEEKYNKNIREVLCNMAKTVGCDYDYLSKISSRYLKNSATVMDLRKFSKLHPAIQRLALRQMMARLKGNMRTFTFQHIKEIEDLVACRPTGSIVNLPGGVSVMKRKNRLAFSRKSIKK
jgi:tRNA(Ile)-lysidine synthase